MESQIVSVIALLLGGALGAGVVWLMAGRALREWRGRFEARDAQAQGLEANLRACEAELRALDGRFRTAITDLAAMSERAARVDALTGELRKLGDERAGLHAKLARMESDAAHFAEQKRLLVTAQDSLKREFETAGAKVLNAAQEAFLARAEARFVESEKASSERLSTVLAPVGHRLEAYEKQVAALEARRVDAFGQLTGQIEAMKLGAEQVRAEAARLGNSLRNAPKARGRWGEQQLRNVLEQCGLAEHTDFVTELSVNTEDGRLRPDAIVTIPGQKKLVIDAKVSLNAYQDAFEAGDDVARDAALKAHVASMRNHIQTLGSKSYQSQFEDAPDYVLMFVPGEHFIAAALEQDPKLWEFAFERRVLLASPTNLVAIARSVAQVWQQDRLAQEAREIGRMGTELHERLAVAAEHLKRVGSGLGSAVDNYNKFVGSFERNVLSAGRRLRDKGIEIGKREIEEVAAVESLPRYADRLAGDDENAIALPLPDEVSSDAVPDAVPEGLDADDRVVSE